MGLIPSMTSGGSIMGPPGHFLLPHHTGEASRTLEPVSFVRFPIPETGSGRGPLTATPSGARRCCDDRLGSACPGIARMARRRRRALDGPVAPAPYRHWWATRMQGSKAVWG